MTKTLESVAALIVLVIVVAVAFISWGLIPAIALALFMKGLIFVILFIRRVPFNEAWVVDRLGTLIEKKPGYRLIITAFGYEILKRKVQIIEYGLPLFQGDPKEEGAGIDLKVGGKVFLIDPLLWIKVNNPITTVQAVADFEELIREVAEHRIRGFVNLLEPDEMLEIILAGKEEKLLLTPQISKRITEFLQNDEGLKKALKDVNVEYKGFTLTYFYFDKTIETKRAKRVEADMDITIEEKKALKAKKTAEAQESEMLAIAETAKKLVAELGISMELATEIARQRQQDIIAADRGDFKKIVWDSRGMDLASLAAQLGIGKDLLEKKKKKEGE